MTTPGEPPRIFRVVGDELGSGPHGEITFMSAKTGRYVKPPERDEAVAPPERPQES